MFREYRFYINCNEGIYHVVIVQFQIFKDQNVIWDFPPGGFPEYLTDVLGPSFNSSLVAQGA